ncbi:Uncharacterized protein GmHk_18G051848 [Glycine max]|nr:Uncharacterized protein GmHk_18G051848 [Glycine max]
MASYLWRKYADYLYTKWEKTFLWDMVEPYRRPKSFTPLVTIYIAAFYSGVIGAAITEQLYKRGSVFGGNSPMELASWTRGSSWGNSPVEMARHGPRGGSRHSHFGTLAGVVFTPSLSSRLFDEEKYWEEHPGKAVPLMRPKFYGGPWRVMGGNEPPSK